MKYVVSLMQETGDREDWQPLATFIADVIPADLDAFEAATLAQLRTAGVLDDEGYGAEHYLWSVPLLAEVTTPAQAATALTRERAWHEALPGNIGNPAHGQWPAAYAAGWQLLAEQVREEINT